jgi:hypothetical protein
MQMNKGIRVALAISDEPDALQAIENLKSNTLKEKPRALVTVAMASIGLDLPAVSHLCYLNHYRFHGFVLQCWARASRVCKESGLSPDQQQAFIYTVRDPRMAKFIDWIKSQSPRGLRDGTGGGDFGPGDEKSPTLDQCWLDSTNNAFDSSSVGPGIFGSDGDAIAIAIKSRPILGSIPKKILSEILPSMRVDAINKPAEYQPSLDSLGWTAARKKRVIKAALTAVCNRVARETGNEPNEVRTNIQQVNGEFCSVDSMSELELIYVVRNGVNLLLRACPSCDTVSVSWNRKEIKEDNQGKRQDMEDLAEQISEFFAEFNIPMTCQAKERR